MKNTSRRAFLASAAALGVSACVARPSAAPSLLGWSERRDLYPEGVASGDPLPDSVILWTRRPLKEGARAELTVEVATDRAFEQVVATTRAAILAESDWTCRVLVGGLQPRTVYWYRFIDDAGNGSRV